MSLKTVSVKINKNSPSVDSISHNKNVTVKFNNQQDYKIKSIDVEGAVAIKVNNQQDYKVKIK